MLSSVLRSPVVIQANINIMRTFVAVREYILAHATTNLSTSELETLYGFLIQNGYPISIDGIFGKQTVERAKA